MPKTFDHRKNDLNPTTTISYREQVRLDALNVRRSIAQEPHPQEAECSSDAPKPSSGTINLLYIVRKTSRTWLQSGQYCPLCHRLNGHPGESLHKTFTNRSHRTFIRRSSHSLSVPHLRRPARTSRSDGWRASTLPPLRATNPHAFDNSPCRKGPEPDQSPSVTSNEHFPRVSRPPRASRTGLESGNRCPGLTESDSPKNVQCPFACTLFDFRRHLGVRSSDCLDHLVEGTLLPLAIPGSGAGLGRPGDRTWNPDFHREGASPPSRAIDRHSDPSLWLL